jgi:hypothetical protein
MRISRLGFNLFRNSHYLFYGFFGENIFDD